MRGFKGILALFLAAIVLLTVVMVWKENPGAEAERGMRPESKEDYIRRKLDHWTPMVP
ncbi:Uncharacterized protein TXXE_10980 [Thermobacillus xylanilyticus]|jgi:hypothetical protein|uniref:Uncharacterized protein n=2 Tax=Thermobacillus TaxID=76632 RepID=L0EIT4_THECK|nr:MULTISPECIES: hypothetical protein [Thermobacillus]AGA59606.1 hypothetical protein Theco_3578 [Thermobacillus composti KWC4]CAG5087504.1 Uncharacterized protein TXXE_10980 [Thermobacillus xylanilyticus]